MTRPLADILRNDRYDENQLSRNGEGGDYERGYRRGWGHAMDHVARELGFDLSNVQLSAPSSASPNEFAPAGDGAPIVSGPHALMDFDTSEGGDV